MKYFLTNSQLTYTRVMLFSWESGSTPSSLSETNGEFLASKLRETLDIIGKRTIIINANHIADVDDHFLNGLVELAKTKKLRVLIYSTDRTNELTSYFRDHFLDSPELKGNYCCISNVSYYGLSDGDFCSSDFERLKREAEDLEREELTGIIASSYISTRQKLSSTPLNATGHFDANILISNPYVFRWLVLRLVDSVYQTIVNNQINDYTIVASSLRGAAIAGSVREILYFFSSPKFYVFDHIGPKHNFVHRDQQFEFNEDESCFYIGDFLIAGTELKMTHAYCSFFGGKITHAFTLGKYTKENQIGSIPVESIVSLKECAPELEYTLE
ncbi:hypothetical protein [Vibrio mediterranei]|uniref:hypothetical protein n=1 Tax=Vibrio mediterranei TaxID=689 RepID=UPI00148C9538|nr:hypothetical protein [Vibrio mediterranei]NOH31619.1 hypothetical protein [Vibrio mediterranei]